MDFKRIISLLTDEELSKLAYDIYCEQNTRLRGKGYRL
jgi:hypothetical protein